MKDYKNYIFDLYGTLIDSAGDEKSAQNWKKWLRWLDKRDICHPDYITFRKEFFDMDKALRIRMTENRGYQFPEIDVMDIYRRLFADYGNGVLDEDTLSEASFAFRQATTDFIKLYDGVEEFLTNLRLQEKNIYILSNAQRSYTMPEIKMFGLDKLTDDQLISSDYGCMKPETDFYEALFTKHNLKKEESVMVGDSQWSDVKGAKNYGIDVIHLVGDNSADKYYLNYNKGIK